MRTIKMNQYSVLIILIISITADMISFFNN